MRAPNRIHRASARACAPKKTNPSRHVAQVTNTPPAKGPRKADAPQSAEIAASARTTSLGGNNTATATKATAANKPPPSPCSSRQNRKTAILGAAAATRQPMEKSTAAKIMGLRIPKRRASSPLAAPATIDPIS